MKRGIIAAPLVATLIIGLTSCGGSNSTPITNQQVNSGTINTTQLPGDMNPNQNTPISGQTEATGAIENSGSTSTTVSGSTDVKTNFGASKESSSVTISGTGAAIEKAALPKAPEKLAPAALEKLKQKWEGEKGIKLDEKQINDIKQNPGYVPAGAPVIAAGAPQTAGAPQAAGTTIPIPQKK